MLLNKKQITKMTFLNCFLYSFGKIIHNKKNKVLHFICINSSDKLNFDCVINCRTFQTILRGEGRMVNFACGKGTRRGVILALTIRTFFEAKNNIL